MLTRIIHIVATLWLAMILLLGTMPKEFVHALQHHKDTVHQLHPHGLSWDNHHHHCNFISFVLDAFTNDYSLPVIRFIAPEYRVTNVAFSYGHIQRCIIATALRGPPAC